MAFLGDKGELCCTLTPGFVLVFRVPVDLTIPTGAALSVVVDDVLAFAFDFIDPTRIVFSFSSSWCSWKVTCFLCGALVVA